MKVIVIEAGKNGKIEMTKEELQEMLDKAFEEGKAMAENRCKYCYRGWYTTCNSDTWTLNSGTGNTVTIPADSVLVKTQ